MKILLNLIAWAASILIVLVGLLILFSSGGNVLMLAAGLMCFAFVAVINPLSAKHLTFLNTSPKKFAAGTASVVLGLTFLGQGQAQLAEVAKKKAEAAKVVAAHQKATEFKKWAMARYPMSEAEFELVREMSTMVIDPAKPETIRRYQTITNELDSPKETPEYRKYRIDTFVEAVAVDPQLQAAMRLINSGTPKERAEIYFREAEAKAVLKGNLKAKK